MDDLMKENDNKAMEQEDAAISKHGEYEQLKEHEAMRKNNKRYTSKLWIWLGVLVLVLILLYWIFFIGIDLGVNQ